MATYHVETDNGTFEVQTDEPDQTPSLMDTVGAAAKNALTAPAKFAGKMANPETGSEYLPTLGAMTGNPIVAGGAAIAGRMADLAYGRTQPGDVGTPLQEAAGPMAQTALVGLPEVQGVKDAIQSGAQNLGRRALGFTKGMIKRTPGGVETLNNVSQKMLDEGVIKFGSGAAPTLERAKDLAETSGQTIGEGMKALDQVGAQAFDPSNIAQKVHTQLSPSYSGGAYDAQQRIANEIRDTILAHGDGPVSFKSAQDLKETLQDLGKFNSATDQLKATMYRKASSIVRQALEDSVDSSINMFKPDSTSMALPRNTQTLVPNDLGIQPPSVPNPSISPDILSRYKTAKQTYGASQRAIQGLSDKAAGEASNSLLSLRGAAIGAGALATGHIAPALEALGTWEAARRVGSASGAAALNAISKSSVSKGLGVARNALISEYISRQHGAKSQ